MCQAIDSVYSIPVKVDVADFYLSVSSELPAAQVIETVPFKLKVGAPDDVEKILNSALPGVRLSYAAQTPAPIPVRVGNHYFALEPHGAIYERMLKFVFCKWFIWKCMMNH